MRNIASVVKTAFITAASPLLLLTGCGSDSGLGAPPGSFVDIQLVEKTWVQGCPGAPTVVSANDQPVLVTIRGPNGNPIPDVDFNVQLDLSLGSTVPGDAVMFFFPDENRDALPDAPAIAPPTLGFLDDGALFSGYPMKTDSSGSKQFILRNLFYRRIGNDDATGTNGALVTSYAGLLNVSTGSNFGVAQLAVECEDSGFCTCP